MEKVIQIFTHDNLLSERDAKHIYAMSKMPVIQDTQNILNQ